jgi:RNA polymerase sigma-70 factor (ECF subfamily)
VAESEGSAEGLCPIATPSQNGSLPDGGSDNELFQRYRSGDEEALRVLVHRYEKRAYWVAFHIVKDPEEARDVVQEAFIRIFRARDSFDPSQPFRTWLFRIVSNAAIDAWRKMRKTGPVSLEEVAVQPAQEEDPGGGLLSEEVRLRIAEILAEIPPKYRQAIVLRDIEGLSAKEIARIVGCTHATARWRLHHARRLFQDLWKRKGGGSFEEILGD